MFKLGPREVDGSADGTLNTGSGTALTRHAFRVRSNVPIVSYQFNPLENVNVSSTTRPSSCRWPRSSEASAIVASRPGGTHVTTRRGSPDRRTPARRSPRCPGTSGLRLERVAARHRRRHPGQPGGRPHPARAPRRRSSLTFVPPIEQWRSDYVLLTPDKYSFDFLTIAAPAGAQVFVDRQPVDATTCEVTPFSGAGAGYVALRCQLSFPVIDPRSPGTPTPGKQNDGVHHVQADAPVSVIAYGSTRS